MLRDQQTRIGSARSASGDHVEVSTLVTGARAGDRAALHRLIELVYPELRRIAANRMRRERWNHTLQPTALINELYIKLSNNPELSWKDRTHFIAIAAGVMRTILIDHARGRDALKRGGGVLSLELDEALAYAPEKASVLLELEEALKRLESVDPAKARIVELRFFGGLQIDEIAEVVGLSERTVKRYWNAARARLKKDLAGVGR